MEYGPKIEVNGKRPAWLTDDELMTLRQWKADAIAKYPDLAPDPDRALKDEILAFCKGHGWHDKSEAWDQPYAVECDLVYAWAKRHPAPVNKPCTLTPEELAQWRLEQARRIAAATWDEDKNPKAAYDARKGFIDSYNSIRATLAVLTEYNITPEMENDR